MSSEQLYIGLDVGGTRIKAGLVTDSGVVLAFNAVASQPRSTREQILANIDLALDPIRGKAVSGLGAGFPSFGDYDRGVLDSQLSAYPTLHNFPLRRHLACTYGIPTRLVPDANLLAYGLLRFGEGKHFENFIAIGLGTGTAVSVVQGGKVLTGPRGYPDAVMHFYTEWGWPGAWRHSGLHFFDHYGMDPVIAYNSACAGDSAALDTWRRVGESLSNTILRLVAETEIQVAIIAGGLANAWTLIEPSVRENLHGTGARVLRTSLPYPSLSGAAGLFREVSV